MPHLTVISEDGNVRHRQFWVIGPLRYKMDHTPTPPVHLYAPYLPKVPSIVVKFIRKRVSFS